MSGSLNDEQIHSVEMILGCKRSTALCDSWSSWYRQDYDSCGRLEAILQLYTTHEAARILVCAPSNSAADYMLERLLSQKAVEFRKNEIFRLNAHTCPYDDVKPEFILFYFFDELISKCPPLGALCYRIIVSTYMSVSLLYAEGVERGHFSHIFLDEAEHASKPETMVPMLNVALTRAMSLLVIIGNPHSMQGPYWNMLLWHCVDNSSYKICSLPERKELSVKDPAQDSHFNHATKNDLP
ncbi:P-loop containing nucleoside triphosphate hydrolases superfamily protein [Quillaja saponaria]|uniref:P-loop containing nucleoside triphosphate hydrolases superfamily protein n=1 Tax=Quillaja saponaria TaxID=32244 RepID=A0AAD7QEH2_QUISA|nr:P-loop containing nucleoside triphosphate hydrolases superfamily protein [Quillaja saponaria]